MIGRTIKSCITKQITMQKLLVILYLLFIITGCAALKNGGVIDYPIGMSEKDFTASQRINLDLVEATQGHSVYKRRVGFVGEHGIAYMYYYFDDGKLVRMRRWEEPDPVVIVTPKQ